MARYSSSCVFLITLALLKCIGPVALAPGGSSSSGGSSSGSGGFAAQLTAFKDDMLAFKVLWKDTWQEVEYSELEDEKGVLKHMVIGPSMRNLLYRFYPARSLRRRGDTSGVEATFKFKSRDITWASRSDNVVHFKRDGEKVYSLKFRSEDDAEKFIAQQTHLQI